LILETGERDAVNNENNCNRTCLPKLDFAIGPAHLGGRPPAKTGVVRVVAD
jgi:hypothetical protein